MAKENQNFLVNVEITGDSKELQKVLDNIASKASTALATGVLKSVEGFAKKLKDKIQISFDDTIISSLKDPIKITLDVEDAKKKVESLTKPLLELKSTVSKINSIGNKTTKSKESKSSYPEGLDKERNQINLKKEANSLLSELRNSINGDKSLTNFDSTLKTKLDAISNAFKGISAAKDGSIAYTPAQITKIQGLLDKLKSIKDIIDLINSSKNKSKSFIASGIDDKLIADLEKAKESLREFGLTENQIEKSTKSISTAIKAVQKDLNLLDDELNAPQPDLKVINLGNARIETAIPKIASQINTADINRRNFSTVDISNAEQLKNKISQYQSTLKPELFRELNDQLTRQRELVEFAGVPINNVIKQTKSYDSSIINIEKNLGFVNKQFKDGNITIEQAAKEYQKITDDIEKLKIGINQIDPKRLKSAFDLEEHDPSKLSFQLAGLGYVLARVSGSLLNFSRNTIQAFTQLATFSEPIEKVNAQLDLQVKQGKINLQEREVVLQRLRSIGDIPGSSVEKANQTFNALQKINISLQERLDLTEGIAKLASSPGGTDDSANRFSQALSKIALKSKVEQDNFNTLRETGGSAIEEFFSKRSIGTATDLQKFGISRFIKEVSTELNKLESPAATTLDRINRLKSRASELGVTLGKILAPGLDNLNETAKKLLEILDKINNQFNKLPSGIKSFTSNIIVLIPVIAALLGGFIGVAAAINFTGSAISQLPKTFNVLKGIFSKILRGGATATATTAAAATGTTVGATEGVTIFGNAIKTATTAAGTAAVGGVEGAVTATEGLGIISKLTGALGSFGKVLSKVLGFSNPIGIAIQVIISAFTALYDNYEGIYDKFVTALSQLNEPINRVLKLLGLDEGGLSYVLGLLGKAFSFIFNLIGRIIGFIGTVVLDVLLSIIQTIRDVITSIAEIGEAFKDGRILDGITGFFKLIWSAFIGFFRNLSINLAALILDVMSTSVEKIIGKGYISDLFRKASNETRKSNQTDDASVEAAKAVKERRDAEKSLAEEVKKYDGERASRLKENSKQLLELIQKTREEYKKFQSEQIIEGLKQKIQDIQDNTTQNVNYYKDLINLTQTGNESINVYNDSIIKVNNNLGELLNNQSKIDLEKGINALRESTLDNKDFDVFKELAEDGNRAAKRFMDSINAAINSKSLKELRDGLLNIWSASSNFGPKFSDTAKNIISRVSATLVKTGQDANKVIIQYKNVLFDLRKQQIERNRVIELEANTRKFEYETRQRELDKRLKDIQNQSIDLRNERNQALESVKLSQEQSNELQQRTKEYIDQRESLRKEFNDIYIKNKTDVDIARSNPNLTSEEINSNVNFINNASQAELDRVIARVKELDESYRTTEKAYISLYSEQNKNLAVKFYDSIYNSLRNLSTISTDSLSKITDSFSRFLLSLLPEGEAGKSKNNIDDVIVSLGELINKTKGISEFAPENIILTKILSDIKSGAIDASEGLEKVLDIYSKIASSDIHNSLIDQQNSLNKSITNYNQTQGGSLRTFDIDNKSFIPNNSLSGGKDSLNIFLNELLKNNTSGNQSGSFATLLNVDSAFSKGRFNNSAIEDILRKALEEGKENFNPTAFVEILANANKEEFDAIINAMFGENNSIKGEILQRVIDFYNKNREYINKRAEERIKASVDIVESQSKQRLEGVENQINDLTIKSNELDFKIAGATGKELKNLIAQQNDIKLKLIDFNFQKLDIEEAYNIKKDIIQADGNKTEIDRITKEGEARRKLLLQQRNQEIKDQVVNNGGKLDANGNPLDANGKPIIFSSPSNISNGKSDSAGNQTDEGTAPKYSKTQIEIFDNVKASIKGISDELFGVKDAAVEAGDSILDFMNKLASGQGLLTTFQKAVFNNKSELVTLGDVFNSLGQTAIAAFGQALGQAISDSIVNGDNFLKSLAKFFGEMLVSIGTQLVALGTAALAFAALAYFFPGIVPSKYAIGIPAAIAAVATGIGLIAAGKLLGAGSSSSASISNTGTSNGATNASGSSGQVDYDPEKDPKMVYQKALRTEVYIDIKRDDGSIVKAVVKQVNRNPKFANLIGNTATGFAL